MVIVSLLLPAACVYASDRAHDLVVMAEHQSALRLPMADWAEFTCTILDSLTGDTLAARCLITSSALPSDHDGFFFYTGGAVTLCLPESTTVIRIGHGPEYRAVTDTVEILGDTSFVYRLTRYINMAELDWFSGDCHVHIKHEGESPAVYPEDAHLVGMAEGLNVVNCLDNDYCFTGQPDSCSTPDCIIYMSEENRSGTFGHMGLLGLTKTVLPFSSRWQPLTMDIADSVHAQPGALVISAHPVTTEAFWQMDDWPGTGLARELPVDVIYGKIDGFEVMSFSNCHENGIELDLWYRLLNCGFRLPACTGTDACLDRDDRYHLAGAYRTYVLIPGGAGGNFSYFNWLSQLKNGRTFVTNGPLITLFEIEGLPPGCVVDLPSWRWDVTGAVSVFSAYPFNKVEIVRNGRVVKSYYFEPAVCTFDANFRVTLVESSWIAVRVYGSNNHWLPRGEQLFAHTSPVYVAFDNERVVKAEDVEYFIQWIHELKSLVIINGEYPDPVYLTRVIEELTQARFFYESLIRVETHVDLPGSGPFEIVSHLFQNTPNPFSSGTIIEFYLPQNRAVGQLNRYSDTNRGADARLTVFDAQGRVIRRLLDCCISPGRHRLYWDGRDDSGNRVASGVYFYHLRVGDGSSSRKMLLIR